MTLALSSSAFAAVEGQWEMWTGSLADVTFRNAQVTGANGVTSINVLSNTGVTLSPSVGYVLPFYGLELKLSPFYSRVSSATPGVDAQQNARVLLGLNYSFLGDTLYNSFFVEAQAGWDHVGAVTAGALVASPSVNKFAWSAGVGKRINLFGALNWVPQFQVLGVGAVSDVTNARMSYSIVPVQFSFFL